MAYKVLNSNALVRGLRSQLNKDFREIQEYLNCNKLSPNVLETHYMIFTPRNKIIAPFHNDFSPSGEKPEQCKSAHTL